MYGKFVLPLPFENSYVYKVPEGSFFGQRAKLSFGKRNLTGYLIEVFDTYEAEFEIKAVDKMIDKEAVFTPELLSLAKKMSSLYLTSSALILNQMIPSGKREKESFALSSENSFTPIEKLSGEQEAAIRKISSKPGSYYLYAKTGTGKSEVYLTIAQKVIKEGGQVIFLVPEISLTHQLLENIRARFNDRVALLHSGLTPSQKLKQWFKILHGEVDIVLGARSAVFAPFTNLKLIIIDEEHENSYKSGQSPRYHARQVAQLRIKEDAYLLMGSATPSLESFKMFQEKKITKIVMNNRVAGGTYPKIELVNMLKEDRSISLYLESEIRNAIYNKKGVILFLNRRGYTYYYQCDSCSHVATCPNCSIALTYHKKNNRMVCHYCGYNAPLLRTCPECGCTSLSPGGFGTQKIEEEVRTLFPTARIQRLDTDIASTDHQLVKNTIDDFTNGKIDILLGTQMIAKGLNFPSLSLVGIVNADSTLSVPDFRAQERTFSLLTQVAGRCGRFNSDGKVIIQTFRIDNDAIRAVKNEKNEEFYLQELALRKALNYPPYSRFISLTLRSKSDENAKKSLEELVSILEALCQKHSEVKIIGYGPSIIERIASSFRYQVILSSKEFSILNRLVKKALEIVKVPSSVYIEIDVDPLSML